MSDLTIHIGLHKTGTSFLQYILFPKLKGVETYRGFNPVRRIMMLDPNKKIIISDEAFSGYPLKPNYAAEFDKNVQRLKLLFGDANIIMGVRNQLTLIPSIYKQYLQEKGFHDINYLYNVKNTGILKHEDLYMTPRIELLKKNFSNVFIYDQKALSKNQDAFTDSIVNFLDLEKQQINFSDSKNLSNKSVQTINQVNKLRKLNKIHAGLKKVNKNLGLYEGWFKSLNLTPRDIAQNKTKSKGSPKFELSSELSAFIEEHYRQDWNAAQDLIDFK